MKVSYASRRTIMRARQQILEPLTDRYDRKAPFREDPDALFRMAQVSLCRMRRDESLNWPAAAWLDEERPPSMRERLSSVRTKMRTFGSFGSRKDESLDERPVSLGDAPKKKDILRVGRQGPVEARIGPGAGAGARGASWTPMVAVAQNELAAAIAAPGTQYRKRRKKRALEIVHSYLDRALQAIETHSVKNDCDDCWRRIQLERMNLCLEHGDEKQAYEIAKQRDLVLFEPEAALYLAERYLEEGRDDEASALTRRAVRWHAHIQRVQGFPGETPPEVSHDLDWAFGDVGERNPFFAADTMSRRWRRCLLRRKVGLGLSGHRAPGGGADGLAARPDRARRGRGPRRRRSRRHHLRAPGTGDSGQKAAAGRRPPLPGLGHAGRPVTAWGCIPSMLLQSSNGRKDLPPDDGRPVVVERPSDRRALVRAVAPLVEERGPVLVHVRRCRVRRQPENLAQLPQVVVARRRGLVQRARSASAKPAIMSRSRSAVHKAALREDVARDAAARSLCPSRSCWIAVAALMATFMTHNRRFGSGRAAMGCNKASSIGGTNSCARSSSVSSETNQPRAPDVVDTKSWSSSRASSSSAFLSLNCSASSLPMSWAASKDAPRFALRLCAAGLSFFFAWRPRCCAAWSSSFARILASSSRSGLFVLWRRVLCIEGRSASTTQSASTATERRMALFLLSSAYSFFPPRACCSPGSKSFCLAC